MVYLLFVPQTFSVGFKSGEHAGHSMRLFLSGKIPLRCELGGIFLLDIKVIFMVTLIKGNENASDDLDIVFEGMLFSSQNSLFCLNRC